MNEAEQYKQVTAELALVIKRYRRWEKIINYCFKKKSEVSKQEYALRGKKELLEAKILINLTKGE